MLIVKIELHSAVTGQVKTVATGKIVNTGTGSPTQGNYRVELRDAAGREWKSGHIEGFPRKRLLPGTCYMRSGKTCRKTERARLNVGRFPGIPDRETTQKGQPMIAQLPNLDTILNRHKIHPSSGQSSTAVEEGQRPGKELRTRLNHVANYKAAGRRP